MSTKYYPKSNERLQKRLVKAIRMSLKKKKQSVQCASKQNWNFLIENKSKEENKTEKVNMLASNIEIFLKKKKTKSVNMLANNIEIFGKKKRIKNINMLANDTVVFLETSEIKKFQLCVEVIYTRFFS